MHGKHSHDLNEELLHLLLRLNYDSFSIVDQGEKIECRPEV